MLGSAESSPVLTDLPTLVDVLDRSAEASGAVEFFVCGEQRRTLAELSYRSRLLAGGLLELGLEVGDRVAVLADNSAEYVELLFACQRLNLIFVPLNSYLRGDFLAQQLEDAAPAAIFVDSPGHESLREVTGHSVEHVFIIGACAGERGAVPFDDLLRYPPYAGPTLARRADIASVLYTSGTTGKSKGCMMPHGQFVQAAAPYLEDAGYIVRGDLVLTQSPMFHVSFLIGNLAPALLAGARIHNVPRFSASSFLHIAREIGATTIYSVGSIGMLLLAQPPSAADAAPHRIRVAVLPGMAADSQIAFEKRFGIPVNSESYGQTECSVICVSGLSDERRRGSMGRPIDGLDLSIVDENDVLLPAGEVGEIVVRPRRPFAMFTGYWRNPDATIATFRNLWHHTGDLGRQDADGTVWFVDRKKDSIRRRGENVSSGEVEMTILKHPAVREVSVHAVPGDFADDDIKACIVVGENEKPSIDDLFRFFKRTLPYFCIPRYVEFMNALPVNAVGKVRKEDLRRRGVTTSTWDLEALGLTVSREERRGSVSAPSDDSGIR